VNCVNPVAFSCDVCITGFTLVNNICQAPSANCVSYDYQNYVCLTCVGGYKLTNYGICQVIINPDPNCLSVDSSGKCLNCVPYFIYNSITLQCESQYCSSFNSNSIGRKCSACSNGFYLDANFICIPIYCSAYTVKLGSCSACISGTSINGNTCYANKCVNYTLNISIIAPLCVGCLNGYTLTANALCKANNCIIYNPDSSCAQC
jgi:hypothetical protein